MCFVPGQVGLEMVERRSMVLSIRAKLVFDSCEEILVEDYLCERAAGSKKPETPFEVNVIGVMAFRSMGCDLSALNSSCSIIDMSCSTSKASYQKKKRRLHKSSKATSEIVGKSE
ncbi:MAG: hypothetical protein GY915_06470 [bacterium]|nr:hypothetical protein [bacterium]